MNTQKKPYRKSRKLEDSDEIDYSQEEAELLGLSLNEEEEIEDDDESEDFGEEYEEMAEYSSLCY